jgi:site-specific recombinase XerC
LNEIRIHQDDSERRLTAVEFQQLTAMPATADEFRMITRSHVLAWRAQLETHGLAGSTICRKLSTLASLFDHLLDAVTGGDPIYSVIRPRMKSRKTSVTVYAVIIERGKATGCCGHLRPNS